MSVRRIVPNIESADPRIGAAFYTDVLGLTVAMDMGWIVTYAAPDHPAVQISIIASDGSTPHPAYSVEVADVEACHQRALSAGVDIVYALTTSPGACAGSSSAIRKAISSTSWAICKAASLDCGRGTRWLPQN